MHRVHESFDCLVHDPSPSIPSACYPEAVIWTVAHFFAQNRASGFSFMLFYPENLTFGMQVCRANSPNGVYRAYVHSTLCTYHLTYTVYPTPFVCVNVWSNTTLPTTIVADLYSTPSNMPLLSP